MKQFKQGGLTIAATVFLTLAVLNFKYYLDTREVTLPPGSGAVVLRDIPDKPWYAPVRLAASGQVSFGRQIGVRTSTATKTYAASQIDTCIIFVDANVTSLAFGAQFKDSVATFATTAGRVLRVTNNTICSTPAADTLSGWSALSLTTDGASGSTVFADGNALLATITLAPSGEYYIVIVKYAATGNGTTTPTVRYAAYKQYAAGSQ